jgi:hypothetical protein
MTPPTHSPATLGPEDGAVPFRAHRLQLIPTVSVGGPARDVKIDRARTTQNRFANERLPQVNERAPVPCAISRLWPRIV